MMVQGIGGDDVFVLDKSDRAFAKAMGMNVSIPNPFKTAFCFQELAKKRDAAVDALIMAHIQQNDPMADESIATLSRRIGRRLMQMRMCLKHLRSSGQRS